MNSGAINSSAANGSAVNGSERVIVLWFPDWPVHALRSELALEAPPLGASLQDAPRPGALPLALVANHRIVACCANAREAGVRAGMRERDAQAVCPQLELHPHDPDRDARSFAPVLSALEEVVTGVETRRPGLAALRARGPARYYGGEEPAAHAIIDHAATLGFPAARIGIADGLFAAEQAARGARAAGSSTIVPAGEARAFLSPLPIARAASERLATTLQGLGIHTLGAFAALPEEAVRQRFGGEGIAAHRRATASGPQHGSEVRPRTPQRDLSVEIEFEPPLNASAALAEAAASAVARFFAALAEGALICTGLRLELTDDIGARHERTWSHPSRFEANDVLDRVRWQAESGALGGSAGEERGGAGVTKLRITPTHTDRAAAHEAGLWGSEPDERVRHHLRGIQVVRGRDSVGTAALRGGRLAAQRQQFTPWGSESSAAERPAGLPWHGAAPAPSLVFSPPLPAALLDAAGEFVRVDAEDLLGTEPAQLTVRTPGGGTGAELGAGFASAAPAAASITARATALTATSGTAPNTAITAASTANPAANVAPSVAGSRAPSVAGSPRSFGVLPRAATVTAWSSPWPLRERWWEGAPPRVRLQVVLDTGDAWLLIHDTGRWLAEGRYD